MSEVAPAAIIRKATTAEHDEAARVLAACFREAFSNILSPAALAALSVERARERLGDPAAVNMAAYCDGAMVGVGQAREDWITLLYLRQSHHGRGIGAQLFRALCATIRSRGHQQARLWCLHNNWQARRFYEHFGARSILQEVMHVGGEPLLHLECRIPLQGVADSPPRQ